MHRYIPFLLLPVWFLLLSACTQQKKEYHIGFSNCSQQEWNNQLSEELLQETALHENLYLEVRSTNRKTDEQIRDIEYFVQQKKVDLLIVAPNETEALAPIIARVYEQGIPVVLVDRTVSGDRYTAHVGVDNYQIGINAAEYANECLGGRGKILCIAGLHSSSPAQQRSGGFLSKLHEYPGLQLLALEHGDWLRETAAHITDSLLSLYEDVDMIVCQNDLMAMGAWDAMQKLPAGRHHVLIQGTDGLYGPGHGLEEVAAGHIDATQVNPLGGDVTINLALDILEGRPYERETRLPTFIVDSTNVKVLQIQGSQISHLTDRLVGINSRMSDTSVRAHEQRTLFFITVILLIFVIIMLIYVGASNRHQARLNTVLDTQRKQLLEQTRQLAEQRDQLAEQRDQMAGLTEQAEAATRAKLAFFTNVSHDFRTPVTLIAEPIRQLVEDSDNLSPRQHELLEVMHKNASILLRLIRQVLDFRKYEAGKLPFSLTRFYIDREFQEWTSGFVQLADSHHIDYHVTIEQSEENYCIVADMEKCERIVYNLLANAFKFTPDGGQISARLSHAVSPADPRCKGVRLMVSDTGIGLSSENIKHVFESFYQADEHQVGSGLGLALCKAFCDLHHGTIDVTSNQGCGTIFSVFLPLSQEGYHEVVWNGEGATITTEHYVRESHVIEAEQESLSAETEAIIHNSRETVLVIDDNNDMRQYIRLLLGEEYSIIEAANGEEGLQQARRYVPNAIICDVMMPIMDGLECCRRLKEDVRTSHIPVALLTAYALDEQRVQGYESGADSYLTKPFTAEMLRSRVRNLIDNRARVQLKGDLAQNLVKSDVGSVDQNFAQKLNAFIYEHLADCDLDVELLSAELGLSRVQLYRKVKSITGYAPNELLRLARLKRAQELILQTDKTVSEIAFDVGFSSSSYLAKCYRDYFGESPTDTMRKK